MKVTHWPLHGLRPAGAANSRIAEFITWVNGYAREHGLDSETIPADPVTLVNLARFAEGEPTIEQGSWNMPGSCCPTSRSAAVSWVR